MLSKFITLVDQKIGLPELAAHCDIPCKIYDPHTAQVAVLSVIRFMDLIADLEAKESLTVADQATLARLVAEKEKHAEIVKHEVRGIWGDYFKAPQFEKFPNASELVHNIMLAGSACKQGIERDKGLKLLSLVNEFAAAFWATKGVETYTATCPYLPEEDVIYPKIG